MKVVKSTPRPDGKVRVTIDLDPEEEVTVIKEDRHYKLPYPLDDVVLDGRHLKEATPVHWCVLEQKWI